MDQRNNLHNLTAKKLQKKKKNRISYLPDSHEWVTQRISCMVGLLGRSCLLKEAEEFVKSISNDLDTII
jgi:hypothetical protein